ncbi:hypothetical protein V474_02500 [Novosphingobium barchaimii LL02]|uniref:Iron uptake protein n=1 Tax=Novosphingobium barchaimii LL02 TaxID=1114963 RepID=A0A0J8A9G3_9SPHN|nr:hypothetical protein [Novosphingobium barchaimii]KMS51935.1 hypothetical protein V474_02500 [Novosphingobium barchaimii LL02]
MNTQLTSRHWLGKASAGLILGFTLALGFSGLLAWAIGVSDTFFSTKGQVTMWSISPVWCIVLSLCFLFRSGLRAWIVLGLANAVVWAALFATGLLGGMPA